MLIKLIELFMDLFMNLDMFTDPNVLLITHESWFSTAWYWFDLIWLDSTTLFWLSIRHYQGRH